MVSGRAAVTEAKTIERAALLVFLLMPGFLLVIPTVVAAPVAKEMEKQALEREKNARGARMPPQQYLPLLNKLIAECPQSGRLYMHRGFWYAQQPAPRWDFVLRDLNKAVKLDPSLNGFCEVHYQRGHAYKSVGDFEKALACYRDGIATGQGLKAEKVGGCIEAAHACLMLHRKKECLQTVEQALKLKPDYTGSYLNMAGLCHEAQDDARALALLQHVSDTSVSEADALVKADLLARVGKPSDSLALLRRLQGRFPNSRAVVDKGLSMAGKYGGAGERDFFARALEKVSTDPEERSMLLVQRLQKEGRNAEVSKVLSTINVGKLKPEQARVFYSIRGGASFYARRYEEAVEDLRLLGPSEKLEYDILLMRADALTKAGEGRAALADYNSAVKRFASGQGAINGRLYRLRAECLESLGQYREAVSDYKQAMKDPRTGGTAAIFMARCYERLGDGKSALKAAEEAIAREPGNRLYQMEYGRLLSKAGRYEDAIKQYDHCLTIRRDWPTPYFERAKCLRQVGRLSEAAADEARGRALTAPIADDLGVHVRKTK